MLKAKAVRLCLVSIRRRQVEEVQRQRDLLRKEVEVRVGVLSEILNGLDPSWLWGWWRSRSSFANAEPALDPGKGQTCYDYNEMLRFSSCKVPWICQDPSKICGMCPDLGGPDQKYIVLDIRWSNVCSEVDAQLFSRVPWKFLHLSILQPHRSKWLREFGMQCFSWWVESFKMLQVTSPLLDFSWPTASLNVHVVLWIAWCLSKETASDLAHCLYRV